MALTKGAPLFRRIRLHVLGPDTATDRGYLKGVEGSGASGKHSKVFPESALSFTASAVEDVLAANKTILTDAFMVPEVYYEPTDSFLALGTPYMLSPGSGTQVSAAEGAAEEQSPVAVGALQGMLDTLQIWPAEVDKDHPTYQNPKMGGLERSIYYNFASKGYQETLHPGDWHDADVYDPTGHPKEGKPENAPGWASGAGFIFRNADEGGRTCVRVDTFTLAEDQQVEVISTSDENHKFFLSGPNQGGVIIDWQADEDGYNQGWGHWRARCKAGTYRPGAWFLTVDSTGGDGNDSIWFAARSIKTDGSGDTDQVLFVSDSSCRVLRQQMSDEIPGMSIGEVIRRALEENVTVAESATSGSTLNYAQILLDNRTFTDTTNTASNDWTHLKEWAWPIDTSLASALSDMLTDCDLDLGPDFSFNGWNDRGSDLSATVGYVEGADPPDATMNLLSHDNDSDPPGPNGYSVQTQDGATVYLPALDDGVFRRFGQLDAGSAGSVARGKSLARKAVADTGDTRRYYHAQVVAVEGAVPWVDFTVCDVIHGMGYRKLGLDVEVTAMTWQQGDTTTVLLDLAEPES